jgi:hypothetical protein
MPERRVNCKKQIVRNINHNRMPERRENCKKQIVSNTNHNRMPERRENCFFTILSSFRHSIVVSITDYLFLKFSLLYGILLWLVLLTNTNHNRMPERRENCKNK